MQSNGTNGVRGVHSPLSKRLQGKVALVTGGASGIGAAIAKLFIRNGAKVIIADIQDELGHSICRELGEPNSVHFKHCNVTEEDDVKAAVDYTIMLHGKLDILSNNAAISEEKNRSILDVTKMDFEKVYNVNVFGAILCAKHAARVMVPANSGCILLTSSVQSVVSYGTWYAYSSSKHAVVGLAKNLCVELGQSGIRVNCISPRGVATPLSMKMNGMSESELEDTICRSGVLQGVTFKAQDVAEAAVFLASDESKYVSGLNLLIDGGFSTTNRAYRCSN